MKCQMLFKPCKCLNLVFASNVFLADWYILELYNFVTSIEIAM